jgi:hypothetical protein
LAKRSRVTTTGFRERGLTTERLRRIGPRPAKLDVFLHLPPHFYPSPMLFRRLWRLTPAARRNEIHRWRQRQLEHLLLEQRFSGYKVLRRGRDPIGLRVIVPARAVVQLLKSKYAGHITVRSVTGLRPRAAQTRRAAASPRLYGVKALFPLQWEGQRRGMQLVESRIILMFARSEFEARRRVERQCSSDVFPTLNPTGHFYRWAFQGVVDVCESTDRSWAPTGTEAYYEIRNRRMKRAYEWHL